MPEALLFGSPAVSLWRPAALRPRLAAGLPLSADPTISLLAAFGVRHVAISRDVLGELLRPPFARSS
jgi:hypothetical protein